MIILLDFIITVVVLSFLFYGNETGPGIIAETLLCGVVIYMILYWVMKRISATIANNIMGMGPGSPTVAKNPFFSFFYGVIAIFCFIALVISIYAYINFNPPGVKGITSLAENSTQPPNLKGLSQESSDFDIEDVLKPKTEQSVNENDQKAAFYYDLGLKYLTEAEEQTTSFDKKKFYKLARSNFRKAYGLSTDKSFQIEARQGIWDSTRHLQKIE